MVMPIDNDIVIRVERWVVENGLMNWNWTNGQVSKEAHADGLGDLTTTQSFWLGVFSGIKETEKGLQTW
jgi:hypothetical protein